MIFELKYHCAVQEGDSLHRTLLAFARWRCLVPLTNRLILI